MPDIDIQLTESLHVTWQGNSWQVIHKQQRKYLFDCNFEFVFNFSPTAKVISIRVHCLNSHQPMPVLI